MRILLDENIPVGFAAELVGHQVETVAGVGWAGLTNGKLLSHASGRYDAFVTMDRSIEHEQNILKLPFRVLVLLAPSNRLEHLRPLVCSILDALTVLRPGQLGYIGA